MTVENSQTLQSVLLVDDDLVDCLAVARLIAEVGLPYRLTTAHSLAEARSCTAAANFDVAILDYQLGDGSGLDLLAELADTPTIILTGAGSEQLAAEALRLRASHYMVKDPGRGYLHLLPATIEHALARRRNQIELQQHQANLAHVARLSMMGELATGLAHEINQPLYAIGNYARGCIQRLDSGSFDVGELREAIGHIASETGRAAEIIRRLRDFVRKREPHRSSTQLNHLIREAVQLSAVELRQRQIILQLRLADDLPLLLANSIQIQQVVLNLIRNGMEAFDDRAERVLEIKTTAGPDVLEVVVRDNGRGFPATDADRLFEPFFTTKSEGLGMGLAISRSIIEAHGGRLWAAPSAGRGAQFHFTLPIPRESRRRES